MYLLNKPSLIKLSFQNISHIVKSCIFHETLFYLSQQSQLVMSAEGLTTSVSDSKSKAALTTTLTKGAATTQTQTLILENVPDRRESLTEDKTSSAKVVQTKKLAKSQAVVSSHHMGVNNNTFLLYINTLQ